MVRESRETQKIGRSERYGATYEDRRENKRKGRREDGELFLSFNRRDFLRENISTRQEQTSPFTITTRAYIYRPYYRGSLAQLSNA